ncbi:receptor-interacting serine/threonine-protein kinase 1 [Carassius gibelio]|uniref:receptor-interacting serine/threonine-protein kinase 1 n=1 Tax=Carassius gibelio TaxID=101364 RepID=UPI002277522F|nr:receptor-interacting serine/threonine-protein kinase 1 [Carassius gibelio]XP_052405315.1 receptor-interacting serine/threonine-protein kinase 1 [Carassius gibelio]
MATAASLSLIKSADLIRREPLDYGGFGEVYLCYHKTLGKVVQKTVYTGPPRNGRQKQSLLEEGSLMSRLSHQRVVKLLGVILEDGDYSLVMELIPRGNLLTMLETVPVPVSVKGRIILEILEGMVYLTGYQVIHRDLKPENILLDKNFHIKITDLGLSRSQVWSKLTREESRRQSRLGRRTSASAAGTLCYMAPEHLKSIKTRFSEKSDVYSFAIVVWVILSGHKPYENARSEEQICHCVCQGERPDEDLIHPDTPQDLIQLMKTCWKEDPLHRPTFKDSFESLLAFYEEKLAANVKVDLESLTRLYEGPEEMLEKLKSITPEDAPPCPRDSPGPLRSSDIGPVEAGIEDLSFRTAEESLLDASVYNTLPQQPASSRTAGEPSSVKSWTKPSTNPNPDRAEELHRRPASSFDGLQRPELESHLSMPNSDYNWFQHPPHPPYTRIKSCPDTASPDSGSRPVTISNASAIQIGNHNTINVQVSDNTSFSSSSSGPINRTRNNELLLKYEEHKVTESHLEVVRQSVGRNWKQVARKLGLTDKDVDTIEHDYERYGLAEKVHQMLERWKMNEGLLGITVGKLCRALEGYIESLVFQQLLLKSQDAAGGP